MNPTGDQGRTRKAALALFTLAAAMSALAVFQWLELLLVRRGGSSICSLNATINCETVWNSAFAERVHGLLGVPVAALGLVWGATALLQSGRLWLALRREGSGAGVASAGALLAALRVIALAGILGAVVFAVGSSEAGALCLTCLGSYLLALSFALVAFAMLPGPRALLGEDRGRSLLESAAIALLAYLLLLWPGHLTPSAAEATTLPSAPGAVARDPAAMQKSGAQPGSQASAQSDDAALTAFLAALNPTERSYLISALVAYRAAVPAPEALAFPPRKPFGDPHAPVHLVEFTDIKCPHCKHLEELLVQLRETLPPGRIAVESRYFPLDGECNPKVEPGLNTSVRCLGAKAQLCLEDAPDLPQLQQRLFAEQESLTNERILQLASSGSVSRAALEACIASAGTAQRLTEDIQLARAYNIEGTPLLLVNGRSAGTPPPAFLYVLALARGDANAPALRALAP